MSYFYGCEFIFDGVSSSVYDLRILNFSSGNGSSDAGSKSNIIQEKIYRRPKPYYYGRSVNDNLEFDLTIGSGTPISSEMRGVIHRWLLGRMGYESLKIVQPDMSVVIYDVIFTEAKNEYIGNLNYGMTLRAHCNAPWGFEEQKTLSRTFSTPIVNETFSFMNLSDDPDYLKPTIAFQTSGVGTSFLISNLSIITNPGESNPVYYTMSFTGIGAGESITVDCDKQIITASSGLRRMANFNKKFFRIIPGMNSILIQGGIVSFTMGYRFARKVGG